MRSRWSWAATRSSARGSSPPASLEAGLVFAGHGLFIPEAHYDDFAGLDVHGKLVVILAGAPATIPGPLAAHMQSPGERTAPLKRLGAIGARQHHESRRHGYPLGAQRPCTVHSVDELGRPRLGRIPWLKLLSRSTRRMPTSCFAGSGHTFAEILEAATSGKPLPRFAIPAKLKAPAAIKCSDVVSENVVAMLRVPDPKLKDEYVVFTAHLDHLGIGKPINGDAIYNGAMDNASGIASILDVAAMLKENGTKLRRSVLFVAVTGEEKGLLGSKFFASAPTVNPNAIVANSIPICSYRSFRSRS